MDSLKQETNFPIEKLFCYLLRFKVMMSDLKTCSSMKHYRVFEKKVSRFSNLIQSWQENPGGSELFQQQ